MEIRELYNNEGYWTTKIQLELFRSVEEYMKKERLTRTQLAKKLGVTKGYVSQVLNGDFDHRLSKLVKLALAIGLVPDVRFKNLDELINNSQNNFRSISWEVVINDDCDKEEEPSLDDVPNQPIEYAG